MTTRFIASVGYACVVQPPVRVRGGASLDVDQRLPESHADLTGAAVADGPRFSRRLDCPDRCDDRRGPAGKGFGERAVLATLPPFIDADPAFLGRVAKVAADG